MVLFITLGASIITFYGFYKDDIATFIRGLSPIQGVGGQISDGSLQVELVDYHIREKNHPESGAIEITLAFENLTPNDIEILIDLPNLRGVDDEGNTYGEYQTNFKRGYDAGKADPLYICMINYNWNQNTEILPLGGGNREIKKYYLMPELGKQCDLDKYWGRVSPLTNWIDITWIIRYEIEEKQENITRLEWRLDS